MANVIQGDPVGEAATADQHDVEQEDTLRAQMYDFLGVLLSAPPDAALLEKTSELQGDSTELGRGIAALARLASATGPDAAEREYTALFIGLGRGELLPFASYYMTGFLNEKPLASLRNDMGRLMIERAPNRFEPEDNIGSLMEMMAGMILGRFGTPTPVTTQKDFFNAHIAPWAGHFYTDLEGAKNSVFYAPVGAIGRVFMEIEREAFRMAGDAPHQTGP